MADDDAAPEQPVEPPAPPAGEEHDPSGLDLARSLARSARGGAPARRRGPRGAGRGGPSSGRDGARARSAASGAHPDDRDPQQVESTVARLVREHGWDEDLRTRGVFARWPEIVGGDVAAHSRPGSLVDGVLVVDADSTAWATQLRLLAPTLVRRLNTELGHGTVTVIEVRGPNLPSWTRGRRSVRGARGPRDTYG
jgi:predicted nucleic acid-binding Zn ribbon protein